MSIDNIIFPVITFKYSYYLIEYKADIANLTSCNKLGLKKGYYNELEIVDSTGNLFIVNKAVKTGTRGCFWGYDIFLNQKIQVSLELKDVVKQIALNDLKSKTWNMIEKNMGFWDSGGNCNQIRKMILKTESIPSLIHAVENLYQI
jgi:hypothetical protein